MNKSYRSKIFRIRNFVLKNRLNLLLLSFCFISLVSNIVRNSRSSLSPCESSKDKLKRLVDCLTSAGVPNKYIIQRSNETSYTEINWQWNTVNGYLEPMAYLLAYDVSDIQSAVICCQLSKIRLVARSGGHSIVKYGFGDSNSLVIDLTKLNTISIDPIQMNCEIGAGARVGLVTYSLWKQGHFMIPVGICPTVGIVGLALGGGYGYYTRLFGLLSDSLLQLEMVDAKGKLLVINNNTNEDLFWALRGGGGGSFGIITKLKLKLYSAPKYVLYGIYQYQFQDFSNYFEAWQNLITSSLPNHIGTLINAYPNNIEMKIFKFYFENYEEFSGIGEFNDLLDSFSFPRATISSIEIISYHEFVLATNQYYSLSQIHDLSELANLTRHGSKAYLKVAKLNIELNMGAINNLNCSETAFVHRGKNLYHIQLEANSGEKEDINLRAISAMNTFYEDSKTIWKHRESYQNYADEDIPDYLERYYGTNLKKLIQVKMRIDPENVFHNPQSIPATLD